MTITKKDVEHVARLARLSLTESEKEKFTSQLDNILGHVEALRKVDTANVPITAHPFFLDTAWREDFARPWPDTESILRNAPDREESYFKVKKVIE